MDQKILDALKTINDKLGGTNDPNENWGSLLQEIAQNVESSGGPVTAGDVSFDPDETYADDTIGSFAKGVDEYLNNNPIEPFVVTLTPTALDYSGTMDKTGVEITQAYLSGRRIRFDVPALSASMDATMFNIEYDGAGEIAKVTANAFVAYNAGSGWMNILVSTDPDDNTYFTNIFALTPLVEE